MHRRSIKDLMLDFLYFAALLLVFPLGISESVHWPFRLKSIFSNHSTGKVVLVISGFQKYPFIIGNRRALVVNGLACTSLPLGLQSALQFNHNHQSIDGIFCHGTKVNSSFT